MPRSKSLFFGIPRIPLATFRDEWEVEEYPSQPSGDCLQVEEVRLLSLKGSEKGHLLGIL